MNSMPAKWHYRLNFPFDAFYINIEPQYFRSHLTEFINLFVSIDQQPYLKSLKKKKMVLKIV